MKFNIVTLLCLVSLNAWAEPYYLEVQEKSDFAIYDSNIQVRIEVADKADAEAQLSTVVSNYFAGVEYTAVFHAHYHGPDVRKPCVIVPLKSSGLQKYVEVYTEVDQYHLPEIVRVRVTDATDADNKAKKIKKEKWFKDKKTKTKVKL